MLKTDNEKGKILRIRTAKVWTPGEYRAESATRIMKMIYAERNLNVVFDVTQ